MARAMKVCSGLPGKHCVTLVQSGQKSGRCTACDAEADRIRGTAAQRGYDRGHAAFRRAVLRRDKQCTMPGGCSAPSKHADHFPHDRDELIRLGLDPNDPKHGRGLCGPHHSQETARRQPGGWNRR